MFKKASLIIILVLLTLKLSSAATLSWGNGTIASGSWINDGKFYFNLTSTDPNRKLYVRLYNSSGYNLATAVCDTPPCYNAEGWFWYNSTGDEFTITGTSNDTSDTWAPNLTVKSIVGVISIGAKTTSMPSMGDSSWSYNITSQLAYIQDDYANRMQFSSTTSLGAYLYINYTPYMKSYDFLKWLYINGSFEGSSFNGFTCNVYLYNFTYNTWTVIDSRQCTLTSGQYWININKTSNPQHFIGPNREIIVGYGGIDSLNTENIYVHYIQLKLDYSSDTQYPQYSNPSVQYPTTYNPGFTNFTVTFTDDMGMSNVYVETNITGVWQNYTMSGGPNYQYQAKVPAGTFSYRFIGIDVVGKQNATNYATFTINKATPSLSVGPLTSITYGTATQTGCQRNSGDSSSTLTLYRNNTQVAQSTSSPINETSIVLGAGTYNYTCTITESQNYTLGYLANQYRIVNKAIPTLTGSVTTPITYETASNYVGSESNQGDSDCSYVLLRNGTQIATGSSVSDTTILGAGAYNYTYYTNGCSNYTSNKDEDILVVNKKNANVHVYPVTQVQTYPYTATQYCTDDSSLLNCKIYRNDVEITNNTQYQGAAGTYTYKANITDTVNYTNYEDIETLTVNKATPLLSIQFNNSLVTYGTSDWENNFAYLNFTAKNPLGWLAYRNNTLIENTSGLVLRIAMDEGNGSIAYDSSGYNNDGTLYNGPIWVDGKFGKVLSFDGVDDYVDIPDIQNGNYSRTITAWVKNVPNSDRYEIVNSRGTYFNIQNRRVCIWVHGASSEYLCSNVTLNSNDWNFVVGEYDYSTNTEKVYVNGLLYGLMTLTNYPDNFQSQDTIGRCGYCAFPCSFNGTIDEVRIYNRALSDDEIQALYLEGVNKLGAGTYIYTLNVSETQNYTANSISSTLTINKATPTLTLYINGSTTKTSFPEGYINITSIADVLNNLTVYLDVNKTGWVTQSGIKRVENTSYYSAAVYNVTTYMYESENYTSGNLTKMMNITISNINPRIDVVYNQSDNLYQFNKLYSFNATVCDENGNSDISQVIFEFNNVNFTVTNNQTINPTCLKFMTTKTDLAAGVYNYKWYVKDSVGAWNYTSAIYTVNKATPPLSIQFNNSPVTYATPEWENNFVYLNYSAKNSLGWLAYRNNTLIENTSGLVLRLSMDEEGGTVTNDSSGYNNDGNVYGAYYTNALWKEIISFNNFNDGTIDGWSGGNVTNNSPIEGSYSYLIDSGGITTVHYTKDINNTNAIWVKLKFNITRGYGGATAIHHIGFVFTNGSSEYVNFYANDSTYSPKGCSFEGLFIQGFSNVWDGSNETIHTLELYFKTGENMTVWIDGNKIVSKFIPSSDLVVDKIRVGVESSATKFDTIEARDLNKDVSGKFGKTLSFNGVDDYVEVPNIVIPKNAITISFWINPSTNLYAGFGRRDLTRGISYSRPHITFDREGDGKIGMYVTVGGVDYNDVKTVRNSWYANTWYHITFTFDGSTFKIYVNGVLENSVVHTGTMTSVTGYDIGGSPWVTSFQCLINEVRIYNRPLSEEEIKQLYLMGINKLGAGTYNYVLNVSETQNYTANSVSNTLTINKGTPSLNLFINETPSNFTITWLQAATIKGNESNIGDTDATYCLYNSTSQVGCGSPFSITYPAKTLSNFSSPYKFVYNTSGGANWTFANSQIYYLFVNKAWNQTDNTKAGEEYEYDLNKKGIPILTKLINITPYNSSVEIGKPLFAYYNFSINNTNNNTGLTTTFTNVYANFSRYINLSIWQNTSKMENTFSSLAFNSPQYFIINVSNITAYETSYSCSQTIYQSWKKYDCNFGVYVIENDVTKNLPVIYYIDYSKLPEWSNRDRMATNWYVDGTTRGVGYEENDVSSEIKFVVNTSHSSSSLDEGQHNFEVIYYIPFTAGGSGGGGGGGGGGAVPQAPQPNVSFEIFPVEITILANPGESKLIAPYGAEHTFSIKNLGIDPIFIKIEKLGDYKDWITTTAITQYQVYYQQPEYIAIDPGKEKFVDFYTDIPFDAKASSYQIIINFVDRDSQVYQTAKINLLVGGPAALLGKIEKILFYPLSFSPNYNFNITKEGIYLRGLREASFPIGWLIIILSLAIPYFITSYILRIRGRRIKDKYKVLIALVSSILVFIMVVYVMVV